MLRRYHDTVLAALVGLMAGSLRVLWPWPQGADSARIAAPPADDWFGALVIALVAALVVFGLVGLGSAKPRSR
jgi:putative membrane protein